MGLGSVAVALALLVVPQADGKETVTWEAVALSQQRGLLDKGTKSYLPSRDIIVRKEGQGRGGRPAWSKSLPLSDTFAVGASVYQESKLDGFGLFVSRRGDQRGFSWEWFERESGSTFRKLQGQGRVSVLPRSRPDRGRNRSPVPPPPQALRGRSRPHRRFRRRPYRRVEAGARQSPRRRGRACAGRGPSRLHPPLFEPEARDVFHVLRYFRFREEELRVPDLKGFAGPEK